MSRNWRSFVSPLFRLYSRQTRASFSEIRLRPIFIRNAIEEEERITFSSSNSRILWMDPPIAFFIPLISIICRFFLLPRIDFTVRCKFNCDCQRCYILLFNEFCNISPVIAPRFEKIPLLENAAKIFLQNI